MFRRIALLIIVLLALASPAWGTLYFAQNPGADLNIDTAGQWDTTAGGGGTDLTWANLQAGDILSANGKTVHIHTGNSFTCLRISTADEDGAGAGAAGGGFTVDAAVTIAANVQTGSTYCLSPSGTGYNLTIVGSCIPSATDNNCAGLYMTTAMTVYMTGDATGGNAGSTSRCGIRCNAGILHLTGSVVAAGIGAGLYMGGGTAYLVGDMVNSTVANAVTIYGSGAFYYDPGPTNFIQYPFHSDAGDVYKYGKTVPHASILTTGTPTGAEIPEAGGYHAPEATEVIHTAVFGDASGTAGTYHAPTAAEVLYGAGVGATTGTLTLPNSGASPYTADPTLVLTTGWYGVVGALVQGTGEGGGGIAVEDIVDPAFVLYGHYNYVGGVLGSFTNPAASNVLAGSGTYGIAGDELTPSLTPVDPIYVLTGNANYVGGSAGTLTFPSLDYVLTTVDSWGVVGSLSTGNYHAPGADEVIWGATVGATTGTYKNPTDAQVLYGIANGVAGTGTVSLPNTGAGSATGTAALVLTTAYYGAANATQGTYHNPEVGEVLSTASFGVSPQTGSYQAVTTANVRLDTPVGVGPAVGSLIVPAVTDVRKDVDVDTAATHGTAYIPTAANTLFGVNVDATTGTYKPPAATDVRFGTNVGITTGTAYIPTAANVRYGIDVDATTGLCYVPTAANTLFGVNVDDTTGTYNDPPVTDVRLGTNVGITTGSLIVPAQVDVLDSALVDTAATSGTYHSPAQGEVLSTAQFGVAPQAGTYHAPDAAEVIDTAVFGAASVTSGTVKQAAVAIVKNGELYGPGGNTLSGSYVGGGGGIDIADIVDPLYVLYGHDNYVGGLPGRYWTISASKVKRGVNFGVDNGAVGKYAGGLH